MSEQQFALDKLYYSIMTPIEKISVGRCYMTYREVVDTLNEQQSTIQSLKEEKDSLVAVIDKNLLKGEHELSIKHKEAKDKMKKGGSSEVSAILDVIFYWRGYIKALEELKERVSDE